MKYIKLNLSLGQKIKLLFFGLIREDILPKNEVFVNVKEPKKVNTKNITEKPINNNIKLDIPFFDMDDNEVKSNF